MGTKQRGPNKQCKQFFMGQKLSARSEDIYLNYQTFHSKRKYPY